MPRYEDGEPISIGRRDIWVRGHVDQEVSEKVINEWWGPHYPSVNFRHTHARLLFTGDGDERMWYEYPHGRGALPITIVTVRHSN